VTHPLATLGAAGPPAEGPVVQALGAPGPVRSPRPPGRATPNEPRLPGLHVNPAVTGFRQFARRSDGRVLSVMCHDLVNTADPIRGPTHSTYATNGRAQFRIVGQARLDRSATPNAPVAPG
jgi:hypothetical protein